MAASGGYSRVHHTAPPQAPEPKKAKDRRLRREQLAMGLDVIEPGHPLYEPPYERDTGDQNVRHYPDRQYHPDDKDMLGEDGISTGEFLKRRRQLRRVWEPEPVLPVIIDFTEVKEPLFPHLLHPSHSRSMAPNAELWREAIAEARRRFPGKKNVEDEIQRNCYLWDRMDAGTLPADFNPYPPKSDKHAAFAERIVLADDRPRDTTYDYLLTTRQTRRRAKRKLAKGLHLSDEEFSLLFRPIEEWSLEELSDGYPHSDLTGAKLAATATSSLFRGELRDKVKTELERRIKDRLDKLTVTATDALGDVMKNAELDGRGRPIVPASAKLRAAEYVLDRMMGKPTIRTESELSTKLTAVLAEVMVAPEMRLTEDGVVPTGQLLAGQRGRRQDHQDDVLDRVYRSTIGHEVRALEGIIDAEVIDDGE
jgi:hypothetical protein